MLPFMWFLDDAGCSSTVITKKHAGISHIFHPEQTDPLPRLTRPHSVLFPRSIKLLRQLTAHKAQPCLGVGVAILELEKYDGDDQFPSPLPFLLSFI